MEGLGLACAIYYGIGSEHLSLHVEESYGASKNSIEMKSFVINFKAYSLPALEVTIA